MTDRELMEKRVLPALKTLYNNAESWFQDNNNKVVEFDWLKINEVLGNIVDNEDPEFDTSFILEAFYMDEDKQNEIIEKAAKGLKHTWHWPWKSQIIYSDEEIADMKKRLAAMTDEKSINSSDYAVLEDKIENNELYKEQDRQWNEYVTKVAKLDSALDEKLITRKEYNNEVSEIARSYGCKWRSFDAERVRFNIWNYSPSYSWDSFGMYKQMWKDYITVKRQLDNLTPEQTVNYLFKMNDYGHYNNDTSKEYMMNADKFIVAYLKSVSTL